MLHFALGVLKALGILLASLVLLILFNVARQLLIPRNPSCPPQVFHYVPWIGCAVSYGMDPLGFLGAAKAKHGPVFTYTLLGRSITATLGPLGSNFVLNGRPQDLNAEQAYTHLTTPVFGTEVVYDVPNHIFMQQKRFVKIGLTTENFRRYVGLIREEVLGYLDSAVFEGDQINQSTSVDAFKASSEITIFTASATLQGIEVRRGMNASFADLYHDLDGGFTPLNFVFPNLPLHSYRRRDAAQKKMSDFYISIMNARRARDEEREYDMLAALQDQVYKNGDPLTDKQISHIMICLLMAGQHTSAATGAWAILRLAEDPDLQKRLWDEQVEYHGDGQGGLKPLEYETLSTPVLSAVIKEILRMHPPIHSIMRKVISDMPVPTTVGSPSAEPLASDSFKKANEGREYVVPKGSYVLAAAGFSQMDAAIWGADVETFSVDRWLDESKKVPGEEDEGEEDYGWGKISKGGKSAYLPFGAGRHRCIGEQFANVQLGTIIATLVRELTWTPCQPFPANDYTTMIVSPKPNRNVTFKRRSSIQV